MDDFGPLKRQLPSPFDQDLSHVLGHINRCTEGGKSRRANEPLTAAFLVAGMRLVRRHLGPGAQRKNPDDQPLLGFLSQRNVVAEVANNPNPFPRKGSESALRQIWGSQSNYHADLLSFALWSRHCTIHTAEVAAEVEQLINGTNVVEAIHALAYREAATLIKPPGYRLGLVARASADSGHVLHAVLAKNYAETRELWKNVYAAFFQVRGIRLRPGMTMDTLADLLMALAEGVALRQISDPTAHVVDHPQQRSLLGTGALALLLGCMETAADHGARPLEEAVREVVPEINNDRTI